MIRDFPLLALAVLFTGCAPSLPAARSANSEGPSVTTLRFANCLEGAGVLSHLRVEVDGEVLELAILPPPDGQPVTLARLELAPGAHDLAVRATTRYADDSRIAATEGPFWIAGEAPAILGVAVRANAAEPPLVDVTLAQGELAAAPIRRGGPALGASKDRESR